MEQAFPSLATDAAVNGSSSFVVPAIIGGKDEVLSQSFDVISPYFGKPVWKASDANTADAIRCVEAAESAFPEWSSTDTQERRRILLKAADIMQERVEEISALWRTETGANSTFTGFVTTACVEHVREYAARTTSITGSVPSLAAKDRSAIIHKVPIGVVLSVVPWNAPPVFASRAFAAPLAAGCTVVVKSSDLSPRSYHALARCYIDAGVPPSAINVVSCSKEAAPLVVTAMIEHPAVRKIHFTGSTDVGRKIAITASANLKPCIMELGGKNSAIVLDDADLETAAVQCVLGAFLNSGQACISTDRILVDAKVAPQFQAIFSAILGNMFASSNAPPALVSAASKERLLQMITDAKNKGASLLEGGWNDATETQVKGDYAQGIFQRPVVVKDVTTDMRIWSDEIFGLAVAFTTINSEEEAIKLANSTEYGLSAAVFTENLSRGFRVAKAINVGAVHINSMTIDDTSNLPFGGVRASGWGRFNNQEGLEEFLVTKTVTYPG